MSFVREALTTRRVVLCVGPGGVGKTTSSAALGLAAAQLGRRVLVVTVDPAKRLATSLGLSELGHEHKRVDDALVQPGPGGALYAMMLDQKHAFDAVVAKYATNPEAVQRILQSPIYAQVSASLAGAHEYAAMATLDGLASDSQWDLIVVDTPPSRHAVDFIDAPAKLEAFIDSPAIEWFRKLRPGSDHRGFSVLGRTGAFILGRLAKFVGSRFLEDLGVFLTEFHDVLGGFREKAAATYGLLRRADVGVIVVSSPEPYALQEASLLSRRLREHQVSILGYIANRVHPSRPLIGAESVAQARLRTIVEPAQADALWQLYLAMQELAMGEREELAGHLAWSHGGIVCIPHADHDIVELAALSHVAQQLLTTAPLLPTP